MDKKLINELNRINSIMDTKPLLFEQMGVVRLFKSIFSAMDDKTIRNIVKSGDDEVISSIDNLKKGRSITDDAMEKLILSVDIDLLSKKLLDDRVLSEEFHLQVDNLIERLKKDNTEYSSELQRLFKAMDESFGGALPYEFIEGLKKEIKNRVDKSLKSANSSGTKQKIAQGFKEGFKSPSVYANMLRNVRRFRWPTKDFSPEEYKRLVSWVLTGTSRLPSELLSLTKKEGVIGLVSSFSGEVLKRYLYLTSMLTGLNFIKHLIEDNATPEAERNPEDFMQNLLLVAKESLILPDLQWVIPGLVIWDGLMAIIKPLLAGSGLEGIKDKIDEKISQLEGRADNVIDTARQARNSENSQIRIEDAKNSASEDIRDYINKKGDGNLYLGDYPITLENNVYMVQLPDGKIKLSDY